ncbi:hypothetical protein DICSQDRAFT_183836 [Dichomitus squalens LYAD-421 SS1]|uniref:Fungal-type protein kinase domain-containing protein n=1 Tax=Dichomitus squalens (strain LYAD-421) TaxID=732165 RepID=R7SJU9_DICSQ|nr:uncharacterized protein DICSQDRAFT_183836 [Dichomitus squalens LYAD-421 SS1]EJF56419.1 hypothetical protein DICSQDRAFT_183836 [Dichomitus squalens LYAD-421 SS1]
MAANPQPGESPAKPYKISTLWLTLAGLDLPNYRLKSTQDMAGLFLKADSPIEFLDAFLPYPSTAPKRKPRKRNPFESLVNADNELETDVVAQFQKVVALKKLCPKMVFTTSERRPDPKNMDVTGQKVDAAFFRSQGAPTDGRPHWSSQVVPAEFKSRKKGDTYDPFDDKGIDFESQAEKRKDVRAQVITYSELIFQHQHRVFIIMLLVMGRRYRLLRWDRAGTVVTPSVDYYKNPDDLCEFLWRISHLDDEALGIDPTAIRLEGDDFDELDTIAQRVVNEVDETPRILEGETFPESFHYKYVRKMFEESIRDKDRPRYKLQIPSGDGVDHFLVGKAAVVTPGMAGRGTQCWVAWHCEGARFVWLKDSWRVSFEDIEKEGDIIARLNHAKIPGVPTLVCHGDIGNQTTLTADWWKHKNPRPPGESENAMTSLKSPALLSPQLPHIRHFVEPLDDHAEDPTARRFSSPGPVVYSQGCHLRHHNHYRVAVAEVGIPLSRFRHGRQLGIVILDCLAAHSGAATSKRLKVRILHRDISDKNIVIYPKITLSSQGVRSLVWGGLLTDWEISKPILEPNIQPKARQPERTGRWQFMSAYLLMNISRRVTIEDELESFFHIVVYYAVRYLKSTITADDEAAHFLEQCYDCFCVHGETIICGTRKWSMVTQKDTESVLFDHPLYGGTRPIKFASKGLNRFIKTIFACISARYKILVWRQWLERHPNHPAHPARGDRFQTPPPSKRRRIEGGSGASHASSGDEGEEYDDSNTGELIPDIPTAIDYELAKKIASHSYMISELSHAISRERDWRGDDKVPDRVSKDYQCRYPLLEALPKPKTTPHELEWDTDDSELPPLEDSRDEGKSEIDLLDSDSDKEVAEDVLDQNSSEAPAEASVAASSRGRGTKM